MRPAGEEIVRAAQEDIAAIRSAAGAAASSSDALLLATTNAETLDALRKCGFNTTPIAMDVGASSGLRAGLRGIGSLR